MEEGSTAELRRTWFRSIGKEGGSIEELRKTRFIRRNISRNDYGSESGPCVGLGVFTSGGDSPGSLCCCLLFFGSLGTIAKEPM